jgi:thiosulfate/3-mercaptopyruvate sulfurtransferase
LAAIKENASQGGRHPLPTIKGFSATLTELGITKSHHLVLYDDKNAANAAARFWWMLKAAGHQKVQVLNGGFQQAKKLNFPISSKIELPQKSLEMYLIDAWILPIVDIQKVEEVSQNPDFKVIDVRDAYRYDGISEPIDLIAGHIPGAINIPFTVNLDENGLFLSPDELRKTYENQLANISPENIIVHCGTGVTACHTLLALDYAGLKIPNLYVGSWSEWSRNNKEMVTQNSV